MKYALGNIITHIAKLLNEMFLSDDVGGKWYGLFSPQIILAHFSIGENATQAIEVNYITVFLSQKNNIYTPSGLSTYPIMFVLLLHRKT